MELIVAVYDDWGIGCCGTQPIALSADRKFFREQTKGAMVIAGRKTIGDFPGQKPLPGRVNVAISRNVAEIPGFTVCKSVEEAAELAKKADRAMVIGGGSVIGANAFVTRSIPANTTVIMKSPELLLRSREEL